MDGWMNKGLYVMGMHNEVSGIEQAVAEVDEAAGGPPLSFWGLTDPGAESSGSMQ